MLIESASLWLAATNCWVVATDAGGPAVVIDAPPDPPGLGKLLARNDLYPHTLLLTHGHVDHMGGAGWMADRYQLASFVHPDDDFLTLHPEDQLTHIFGMTPEGDFAPPSRLDALWDGLVVEMAGLRLETIHTPGHTPGHCCFYLPEEGVLFGGDQLFAGSIGRTDLPGGDYPLLMQSMGKLFDLPGETRVLPGHGPSTTLAVERRHNPFLADLA